MIMIRHGWKHLRPDKTFRTTIRVKLNIITFKLMIRRDVQGIFRVCTCVFTLFLIFLIHPRMTLH